LPSWAFAFRAGSEPDASVTAGINLTNSLRSMVNSSFRFELLRFRFGEFFGDMKKSAKNELDKIEYVVVSAMA
jgi:hypothetical protein